MFFDHFGELVSTAGIEGFIIALILYLACLKLGGDTLVDVVAIAGWLASIGLIFGAPLIFIIAQIL